MSNMYKKILLSIGIIIFPLNVYGITFDSNISTVLINKNYIKFSSYISPSEIEYILSKNNVNITSYEDHVINKKVIKNFYLKNISIKDCNLKSFKTIDLEEYIKNIHEKGYRINLIFNCKNKVNNLDLEINTFKYFPNQKYSISIYNFNKSNNKILFKVLTKKDNTLVIKDLDKLKIKGTKDSDCDGLNDEEEKIYGTNPFKKDTDGDNYSDYEEVKASLEPLNNILGPGQNYRKSLPIISYCKNKTIEKEINIFQKIISKILNFLNK